MLRLVVAAIVVFVVVSDVDARPWRRRRAYYTNYNTTYQTYYTTTSWAGGPQEVAEAKAQQSAARGIKGHLGGGFGGAYAEGVGFSTYSADAALNSCCFTGQRVVAGSAVVRGNDGWYAVKMYW